MKKAPLLLFFVALLTGCAHKDLKAPCAIASLEVVPCASPVPIGMAFNQTEPGIIEAL